MIARFVAKMSPKTPQVQREMGIFLPRLTTNITPSQHML
jgi:Na+-translocating ferredoxin:NAD+ oxidoreductase RnfA subunit